MVWPNTNRKENIMKKLLSLIALLVLISCSNEGSPYIHQIIDTNNTNNINNINNTSTTNNTNNTTTTNNVNPPTCGNGFLDPDETCDGTELNGEETCESLGNVSGVLGCLSDCSGYDEALCVCDECFGSCYDLQNDDYHCGNCSTMCDVDNGESCNEGVCETWDYCDGEAFIAEDHIEWGEHINCWGDYEAGAVQTCHRECCNGIVATVAISSSLDIATGDPNNCGGCGIICQGGCGCIWENNKTNCNCM